MASLAIRNPHDRRKTRRHRGEAAGFDGWAVDETEWRSGGVMLPPPGKWYRLP